MEIIASVIKLEARRVLRQLLIWVDFPPKVLEKAIDNALKKDDNSPSIYLLL